MCVIVSKCLIFMFVEQLIFVDVFSQLYYPIHAKKQQWRTSVINRLTIPGSLHSRKCGGGGGGVRRLARWESLSFRNTVISR